MIRLLRQNVSSEPCVVTFASARPPKTDTACTPPLLMRSKISETPELLISSPELACSKFLNPGTQASTSVSTISSSWTSFSSTTSAKSSSMTLAKSSWYNRLPPVQMYFNASLSITLVSQVR